MAKQQEMGSLISDAESAAFDSHRNGGRSKQQRAVLAMVAIGLLLVAAGVLAWRSVSGPGDPGRDSRRRTVIDAQTREVFEDFAIRDGTRPPWKNPKTGVETLYPAEACFWAADGVSAKLDPTWVLLNEHAGLPGETTCPECGKPVRPHNPMPPDELMAEAVERETR